MDLDEIEAMNDRERAAIIEKMELERLRPVSHYDPTTRQVDSAERLRLLLDAIDGKDG